MNYLENLGKRRQVYQLLSLDDDSVSADWPMQTFINVFEKLSLIVQPLSLTFDMAYCSADLPFLKKHIFPPKATWHIREAILPKNIEVHARFKQEGHQEITVKEISVPILKHYLQEAHDQVQESYLPTLNSAEMFYTRARILTCESDEITLKHYSETYTLPIESRLDGYWISGPLKDVPINPPIKVEFLNNNGRLEILIAIGWSLWADPSTQEARMLKGVLQELESCGWSIEKL